MTNPDQEWWQTVFDDKYLNTYIDVLPTERTKKEVSFIINKLDLPKGASILDLACGHGRHALKLAQHDFDVTGVDYSQHFIDIAKKQATEKKINIKFVQADMRELSYKEEFDAVINVFTSFGYFKKESDNVLTLRKISSALKTGGKFLINLGNEKFVSGIMMKEGKPDKQERIFTKKSTERLSNGLILDITDKWDTTTKRWNRKRVWHEDDQKREYEVSVRLFNHKEMKELLEKNGFQIVQTWGDFNGASFDTKNSKSMIILARKSEDNGSI